MIKIAIVGNIASGKSTVENILKNKGFKVFDTDEIAHKILETNPKIREVFGTTDRKKIAKIVFSDSQKLKTLESIIHPLVKEKLEIIFSGEEKVIFVSVPQLFEAGFETMFDKIIYITADKNIRKKRIIKRNSFSPEEAEQRIEAQQEEGKKEKCDFVIENNGNLEDLNYKITNFLENFNIIK